jgi:hypothetical protein
MDKQKLIKDKLAEWIDTLPIKDHIKEWEIIYQSALLPLKGAIELTKWDIKLYTHMVDSEDNTLYIVVGVKTE